MGSVGAVVGAPGLEDVLHLDQARVGAALVRLRPPYEARKRASSTPTPPEAQHLGDALVEQTVALADLPHDLNRRYRHRFDAMRWGRLP